MKPSILARPSAKPTVTIGLFVFCCLLSTVRILRQAPHKTGLNADDIAQRSERRFAVLKSELPAQGTVGYIGESGDSALPDYYLAQYALAPLVVDHKPNHPLVIGNFSTSSMRDVPSGLEEIKDYGDGIVLFRNQIFSNKDLR